MNFVNKLKNYNFVTHTKQFLLASLSIMLIGLLVIIFFGFNLGIDFTGGTVLKVNIGATLEQPGVYENYTSQIETIVKNNGLTLSLKQQEGIAEEASIMIRFQDIKGYSEQEMQEVIDTVSEEIVSTLGLLEDQVENSQRIGPSASAALVLNALLAILFATMLILGYIAFRFELLSGLAAIGALAHDILIMLAAVAILRIQINSTFIAALITIIGYSINNTIVVFDRVRENGQKESYKEKSNAEIVDISIKETLTRSINTSLTTLFTISVLAIFSDASIREFILPIIIGLLAGTYSSIFLSAPVWAIINDKTKPKNKNKRSLREKQEKVKKEEVLQV